MRLPASHLLFKEKQLFAGLVQGLKRGTCVSCLAQSVPASSTRLYRLIAATEKGGVLGWQPPVSTGGFMAFLLLWVRTGDEGLSNPQTERPFLLLHGYFQLLLLLLFAFYSSWFFEYYYFLKISLCVCLSVLSLCQCLCRGQKRVSDPWSWSYKAVCEPLNVDAKIQTSVLVIGLGKCSDR